MSEFNFNKAEIISAPPDPIRTIEYVAKVSNPEGQNKEWERGRLLK